MVKPKHSWWNGFTAKDFFAAIAFFGGLYVHYEASQISTREAIMEIKGDIKVLNVRVDNIENKNKPLAIKYNYNNRTAILPTQIKYNYE